ncbi:hypothetical protein GJ699_22060 [Duganella sp. FT80W]|uniref:Toxin VasX N-terminal region domain-containing protein n=1 Tax=Duganella guangzhouensis TaxID=2666084 RepID=A0A6I2L645_9BURK|nr:T6SS effector BTH_I2691 family protein [Duganella guangzhouensis]MRW92687.1 hypothetical protein [Duganella guangzhouensis]
MVLETCSFCEKPGLLLYPVRYAVACPAGASLVPGLRGNFKIENGPAEIATAKYTLRAIRTGYLYAYDEKRDRLKAYLVMPGGHLWNFPPELPAPSPKNKAFSCTSPVEEALSMCINVEHSEKDPARVLWLGWSNTAWTPALIKKVKNDEWRRKHMRGIDIPWMLTGMRDTHNGEFTKVSNAVAHFVMDEPQMQKAFGFSNTPIGHEVRRQKMAEKFIKAFERTPMKEGYIVAIDDPVGITNDLSELTVPTDHSDFDVELYRGRIIEEILQSTEAAVRQRARDDFDFNVAQRKKDDETPPMDGLSYSDAQEILAVIKAGGPAKLAKRRQADRKKYGVSVAAQRRAAEDAAWSALTTIDGKSVLDAQKRSTFPVKYKSAIKAYEKQGVALAQAHVDWLTSVQLREWMNGVHDDGNLASGFAYRESLAQCIGKGTATDACDKQLIAWLKSADALNTANLYARAMLFNQADIINAAAAQIKGGDVKLKNLLNIYKQGMSRLKEGQEFRLVDKLVFTATNSMVKALGQYGTRAMRDLTVISLSLLGKTVIAEGKRSPLEVANWVISEAEKRGVDFGGYKTPATSVAQRAVEEIQQKQPGTGPNCIYEFDMATLERESGMTSGVIKTIKIPGYSTIEKWLGSSTDFNVGAVAVVLQLTAFAFAYRDFKVSDRFESTKLFIKLGIAVMNVSGALIELTGTAMEKAPTHPLSIAISEHWAKGAEAGKKVLIFGKGVSFIAGLATAAFDIYESHLAYLENDKSLSILYGANAALGIALSLAGCFSLAIFWPLFVAALLLAIVISVLKKSQLTKWLNHCFFSANYSGGSGYPTLEEELIALQGALGT